MQACEVKNLRYVGQQMAQQDMLHDVLLPVSAEVIITAAHSLSG